MLEHMLSTIICWKSTFILGDEEHTFEDTVIALTSNFMIIQYHEDGDENAPLVAERSFTTKQDAIDFAASYGEDCSTFFDQF